MIQCWRVDDRRQTLALAANNGHMPEVIYWGAALPEGEDLNEIAATHRRDGTFAMTEPGP